MLKASFELAYSENISQDFLIYREAHGVYGHGAVLLAIELTILFKEQS